VGTARNETLSAALRHLGRQGYTLHHAAKTQPNMATNTHCLTLLPLPRSLAMLPPPQVQKLLDGDMPSAVVMAYGVTSAGKTFTCMVGGAGLPLVETAR
jgi:hypothetical protein